MTTRPSPQHPHGPPGNRAGFVIYVALLTLLTAGAVGGFMVYSAFQHSRSVRRWHAADQCLLDAQSALEYGIRPDMILARVEGIYRGRRLIDCRRNRRYRFLSALWMACRPFRRWLCALRHPSRTGRSLLRRLGWREKPSRRKS